MPSQDLTLAMAIDGGGTKTTASLASRSVLGETSSVAVIGQATSGPSNPTMVAVELARANIAEAADAALKQAGLHEPAQLQRLLIGLAGVEAAGLENALVTWAKRTIPAAEVQVMSDVSLLAYAGQSDAAVIVVISGTGSVAVAHSMNGARHRCGGRGYLIGDEGSGYWIGAEGMRQAVSALDQVGEPTMLTTVVATELGTSAANEWTKLIYGSDDPRAFLAEAAKWVVQCAKQGDDVATSILEQAGVELAKLACGVARRLDEPFDLILAGGILANVPRVRAALERSIGTRGFAPRNVTVCVEPAREAALRASAVSG